MVVTFRPRSKYLLISRQQSPSAVILEPPKIKVSHCFHCFPVYLPWSDGTRCHELVFWMLSFKPPFSPFSFILVKRLFSSSAVRVVSPAYLKLSILLPAVVIPACESSGLAFCMTYAAYKLNKQGDNIQPCHTSFPILNQSVVPYLVLIVASWYLYMFLRRQVRWSGIPVSLRISHKLLWSTQSKL